jgi:hypothetical protein
MVFKRQAAKRFGPRIVARGERWELSLATFQENRQPAVELSMSDARTQLTSQKWSRNVLHTKSDNQQP